MEAKQAYLDTIFIARQPKSKWPDRFVIITASNPYSSGRRIDDGRNHSRLRKTLSRLGVWKHPVTGASRDWRHREKGYAVDGLDLQEALAMGRDFQQNAIFKVEGDRVCVVDCGDGETREVGKFRQRLFKPSDEPKYSIYVVRLDNKVLKVKRFLKANPGYRKGKPCFYVGMTGLTPDERFANHKAGHRCCSLVRDYGLHLARRRFASIPLLSRAAAELKEREYAEQLRSSGYGVWQH